MSNNTGGPAFPGVQYISMNGKQNPEGMTLRDYFAAKAMKYMGLPTMVSWGRIGNNTWSLEDMEKFPYKEMCRVAYRWADAMIEVRQE